jgi:hypothetical protein
VSIKKLPQSLGQLVGILPNPLRVVGTVPFSARHPLGVLGWDLRHLGRGCLVLSLDLGNLLAILVFDNDFLLLVGRYLVSLFQLKFLARLVNGRLFGCLLPCILCNFRVKLLVLFQFGCSGILCRNIGLSFQLF